MSSPGGPELHRSRPALSLPGVVEKSKLPVCVRARVCGSVCVCTKYKTDHAWASLFILYNSVFQTFELLVSILEYLYSSKKQKNKILVVVVVASDETAEKKQTLFCDRITTDCVVRHM